MSLRDNWKYRDASRMRWGNGLNDPALLQHGLHRLVHHHVGKGFGGFIQCGDGGLEFVEGKNRENGRILIRLDKIDAMAKA